MPVLTLTLAPLPADVRGIYGPNKNIMPARALFLFPAAARSFMQMHNQVRLRCSDIFRSAEASLAAIQTKSGVQPPGYSGHNYGFSIDVAVDRTMADNGWKYEQLRTYMSDNGWVCHRRDGKRGSEDWHFNYLGDLRNSALARVETDSPATWSRAVEYMITSHYGDRFTPTVVEVQQCLQKVGLYKGAIDGDFGQLTRSAALAFARAWKIQESAIHTPRFNRTLVYVAANIVKVAL